MKPTSSTHHFHNFLHNFFNGCFQTFNTLASLSLLCLSMTCHSIAEYIPPDKVEINTPDYPLKFKNIPLGNYMYEVSWKSIPVVKATVAIGNTLHEGEECYEVKVDAVSSRLIKIFYNLKYSNTAIFTKQMKPKYYIENKIENGTPSLREIIFQPSGLVKMRRERAGRVQEQREFIASNTPRDPVTAAFYARAIDINSTSDVDVDVYNAKHRYKISFRAQEDEFLKLDSDDLGVSSTKLTPTIRRLTDTDPEKRIKQVSVWLSRSNQRLILKLESKVWIGSVNAHLVEYN